MSKELKITAEELIELQKQQEKKQAILHDLGILATQSHTLSHMFAELANASENTKKVIEGKYGDVTINLQDGSYKITKDEKNK